MKDTSFLGRKKLEYIFLKKRPPDGESIFLNFYSSLLQYRELNEIVVP